MLVKRVREVRMVAAVHAQKEASEHVELGACAVGGIEDLGEGLVDSAARVGGAEEGE